MPSSITVIGCSYVGITTGACFAHLGHDVTCVDIDEDRVAMLARGEVPIVEPGLDNMVREGIDGGRLRFRVGAAPAVANSEFVYLCVQTPMAADGSADLSFIEAAAREIGPAMQAETVVVNKSTVPVGSTVVVERVLGREDVFVVSNPEFLREGSAVHDFLHPDRIVIGADDQSAAIRVAALYLGIATPLIVTDPASAETIKYAANAFLATKISFVNALAAVCEAVGADMGDVVLGLGYDPRIGHEFLRPGPGWGGSCFMGSETVLVRRADQINLLSFRELAAEVDRAGPTGWEALAWRPGEPTPEFLPVSAVSTRPYRGDVVTLTTKMGRRVTVTADHPLVVGNGVDGDRVDVRLAEDVSTDDWMPIAQGFPLVAETGTGGADAAPTDEESWRRVGSSLALGRDRYDHALPDQIWTAPPSHKRALLRGLWDGDGSWSLVDGGPSVVFEYGTVSPRLADGMLRLLGDLGVVARQKVGPTAKSTVDCHWLTIGGADQLEDCLWLFPESERDTIRSSIAHQAKRIKPTGYRRLSKNAVWARVAKVERQPYDGTVYSIEVPGAHTVVTTGGLVCHQCLPKDTRALIRTAEEAGYDFDLLKGVVAVNEEQFDRIARKAVEMAGGSAEDATVAVWGLTFKARTDDLRDSPALSVVARMVAAGARVRAYDPTVMVPVDPRKASLLEGAEAVADPYAACEGADVLVLLTEWEEFKWLDFDKVGELLKRRQVLDARNLLDREALRRRRFDYQGIGRA